MSTGHGLGHHLSPAPGARDFFGEPVKVARTARVEIHSWSLHPGRLTAGSPTNHHPFFSKENDLNQASMSMEPMLIFQGVTWNNNWVVATQIFLWYFHTEQIGEDSEPILTKVVSNGLVQPPTSYGGLVQIISLSFHGWFVGSSP